MDICKLSPTAPYGSNCYLIASGDEYAVVDPSADYYDALAEHPEIEGKVRYVLLTHAHFDHILAINSWADKCEAVVVGDADSKSLSDSARNCYLGFLGVDDGYYGAYKCVGDGEKLSLGENEISVIACPGHTPGGVSYMLGEHVFCGDTVFAGGGYGRCDLPGGDIEILEKTLIRLITELPSETTFYPGHGPQTTLKELIYYFM